MAASTPGENQDDDQHHGDGQHSNDSNDLDPASHRTNARSRATSNTLIALRDEEREIARHLQQLIGGPWQRLAAVLETYAFIVHASHRDHGGNLVALLHDDRHLARPRHLLLGMIGDLLEEALRVGDIRDDIPPDELGAYCLNALDGARVARSKAAVRRLVTVTLDGLRAFG